MATRQQIDDFHRFAAQQVENGGAELSMDELYSLWRARNPRTEELSAGVAAVSAAYADLEAGDHGRPAREALRKSCHRLGLVVDE